MTYACECAFNCKCLCSYPAQTNHSQREGKVSSLGAPWMFAFWRWLWRWHPSLSLRFFSLLHKAVDIEISGFTFGVPKCPWTGIGAPQKVRQWGLFMISAREMRPKDRIREGVIKTSQPVVRMHSGVLVDRFWWVWESLWRSEGWWGILYLHRTSFRDCSPRTPGSVCPGQTCYITPLLLVVSPVSP